MKFVKKVLVLFILGAMLFPAGVLAAPAAKEKPQPIPAVIKCPGCGADVKVPKALRRKKKGKKKKKGKRKAKAPKAVKLNCPSCRKPVPFPPAAPAPAKDQPAAPQGDAARNAGNAEDAGNPEAQTE